MVSDRSLYVRYFLLYQDRGHLPSYMSNINITFLLKDCFGGIGVSQIHLVCLCKILAKRSNIRLVHI